MLEVRYDGFGDVLRIRGQVVARGGVFTVPNNYRDTVLRSMANDGHRFSIMSELPDDEQKAAADVVIPPGVLPVPVEPEATGTGSIGDAPPVANDKRRK